MTHNFSLWNRLEHNYNWEAETAVQFRSVEYLWLHLAFDTCAPGNTNIQPYKWYAYVSVNIIATSETVSPMLVSQDFKTYAFNAKMYLSFSNICSKYK